MAAKTSASGHVVVFPFPFTCHPLPLFNLVRKLSEAAPNMEFSFITTSKSHKSSLFSSTQRTLLPPNMKTYIYNPEPPQDAENVWTNMKLFIQSLPEGIRSGVDAAAAETSKRVTCLMSDAFLSFEVNKVAVEMDVPWVAFWVAGLYSLSARFQVDRIREVYANCIADRGKEAYEHDLESIPGMSAFRFRDLPSNIVTGSTQGNPDSEEFYSLINKMPPMLPKASAVLINSYEELNPSLLTKDLKSKFQNLLYVGFSTFSSIPPPPLPSAADATRCLSWLDTQKHASVAYICFGTGASLPGEELLALAEALEASGVPFLWSLRDNLRGELPDGFIERTELRGKVVPWTPQTQVLGHGSVGVHVTHCGYNSVSESIMGEVPMICRPVWAENHMNARMVERVWGIGVGVEGGVITKSGMIKCLEIIFHHDNGRKMREAVGALKDTVIKAAGPSGNASRDFGTLLQLVSTKNILLPSNIR